jgi:hypothetical protein
MRCPHPSGDFLVIIFGVIGTAQMRSDEVVVLSWP